MKKRVNKSYNPYLPPNALIPDGEPHVFGNRLYVFGSHDLPGSDRYCPGPYEGWSASPDDLSSWKYEGVILEKGEDPYDTDGEHDYYAPDVTQGADGRYYLYYSISGSMVISVAVCDTPAGKYHFYGHVRDASGHVIGSAEGDDYQFDPAVLNDDGTYYLYSGQGLPILDIEGRKVKGAMCAELCSDMLTLAGPQKVITSLQYNNFEENPFFEASSIRKYNGKYYFVYSPLPNTHYLCYAMSDHPDRDFRYAGVLVSNADIFPNDPARRESMNFWGNNHGGMVALKDAYYIFYHKNSNRSPYARIGCADRIMMNPDGTFTQADMTSAGLGEGNLPVKGCYPAYIAWRLQGKQEKKFVPFSFMTYEDEDPCICYGRKPEDACLSNIGDGCRAAYRYFIFDGTEESIRITVRGKARGKVTVSRNGEKTAELEISPSTEWTGIETQLQGVVSGRADLLFEFELKGRIEFLSWEIR